MEFSNFSEFGEGGGRLHSHLEEENQNHFEQGEHVGRKLRNPNCSQESVGPDMLLVSGSGKLKVASIVKGPSVVGEKVEELMPNIPKQLLLIPKPVGLGRPKGMENFGDKGAGNRDGMGATRGGGGGGRRAAASAAADEDFSLRLSPSASCTELSTS